MWFFYLKLREPKFIGVYHFLRTSPNCIGPGGPSKLQDIPNTDNCVSHILNCFPTLAKDHSFPNMEEQLSMCEKQFSQTLWCILMCGMSFFWTKCGMSPNQHFLLFKYSQPVNVGTMLYVT